ncbi:MAG TPA: LysR family transcriptional regulator [Natronosporangium sp.]|nr:LysR family transcriptional regulator [Natronosporangium sp.]
MNLAHLRYFAAVVEHGNVTRAAERLFVSQPTVSAALRTLERELGQPLFDRVGRRLRVTPAGAEAYRRVVRILAEWDDTRALARRGDARVRLRLGVLDTLPHRWVCDLVDALGRGHPRLAVTVRSGSVPRLATLLAGARLDAAVTSTQVPAPRARVLQREPFVAVFHPDHRLARRHTIALRDLAGEPFVERGHCEIMDSGRAAVRQAGVRLTVVARVHSDDLAMALVGRGFGYTLAPVSLATGEVRTVPVEDFAIERCLVVEVAPSASPQVAAALAGLPGTVRWS